MSFGAASPQHTLRACKAGGSRKLHLPTLHDLKDVLSGRCTRRRGTSFGPALCRKMGNALRHTLEGIARFEEDLAHPFGNQGKDFELGLFCWFASALAVARRVPFSAVAMMGETFRERYPEIHAQLVEQVAANRRTFSLRHADGTPFTAAVYQPLGERAWPDVLCSVRGRGKGNEGKSRAGSDIVSWNSGRAVPGHLYMPDGRGVPAPSGSSELESRAPAGEADFPPRASGPKPPARPKPGTVVGRRHPNDGTVPVGDPAPILKWLKYNQGDGRMDAFKNRGPA